MYQEKEILEVWQENSTCNIIRGTDSTIFPPSLTKDSLIYIFVPDICGYILFYFLKYFYYT